MSSDALTSLNMFQEPVPQTSVLGAYLNALNVENEVNEEEESQRLPTQKAFFEIDNYAPRPLNPEKSLGEYWECQKIIYPYLFKLFKVIQCVPATQVSVERSFSALKLVLSDLRSNLSAENLEKLMFVKINQ